MDSPPQFRADSQAVNAVRPLSPKEILGRLGPRRSAYWGPPLPASVQEADGGKGAIRPGRSGQQVAGHEVVDGRAGRAAGLDPDRPPMPTVVSKEVNSSMLLK